MRTVVSSPKHLVSLAACVLGIVFAIATGGWIQAIWALVACHWVVAHAYAVARPTRVTSLTALMPPDVDEREFANRLADELLRGQERGEGR